ncbi:hypothetical protein [Streptosporangium sp. H16]|uniref:hypothetical protein n=1 Tax=Streptosporangium sp. H16 TaxID=3444184 RepID=UPI003F7AD1B6
MTSLKDLTADLLAQAREHHSRRAAKTIVGGALPRTTALTLAEDADLAGSASRACCERKKAEVEHPEQALMRLARRRVDVLFAMLHDGTFFEPHPAPQAA